MNEHHVTPYEAAREEYLGFIQREDFLRSVIVDHLDGVMADVILEQSQIDGADSQWGLQ